MKNIWVSEEGEVICQNHAGNYLTVAINMHPNRQTHITPLTIWQLMETEYACEECLVTA